MDLEDLPKQDQPLDALIKEDLSSASIEDLDERVASLEGEIQRVKAIKASKSDSRVAAEAFFKS